MKTTVSESDFRDAFRAIRPDNFSYAGLGALYEYLQQYEEDTEQEMELDVIAICCDFGEYDLDELASEYGYLLDKDEDKPETAQEWADILGEHTTAIPVSYRNSVAPEMNVESVIVHGF